MKATTALALVALSTTTFARHHVKREKCTTSSVSTHTTTIPVTPIPASTAPTPATTSTAAPSTGVGLYITTSSNSTLVTQYAYVSSSNKIFFTPNIAKAGRFNASPDPRYTSQTTPGCPINRALQVIPSGYYALSNVNDPYHGATGFSPDTPVHAWPVMFGTTAATIPNGNFVAPLVNSGTKEVWLQLQFTVEKVLFTANIPQVCGVDGELVLSDTYLKGCQNVTLGYL